MLDYRARKLYLVLIAFPMTLVAWCGFLVALGCGVLIARHFDYGYLLLSFATGYVAFELSGYIFYLVFKGVSYLLNRVFLWTIDVEPSQGRTKEEAKILVLKGEATLVSRRYKEYFDEEGGDWKPEYTEVLAKNINWRAKLFFNGKERVRKTIETRVNNKDEIMRAMHENDSDTLAMWKARIAETDWKWYELAIVHNSFFNSLKGLVVLGLILIYFP